MEGIFLARPEEPAAGPRLAVKDLLDTAGLVTTYGSILFADHVPAATAESVRRLEAAGYAVVGKTNLHEFAYGISSQNQHFGTVPNPASPGRLAGGSSGGSAAALAAGLADLALGTDSGGSIRIPAAWCGVVGFKPTYELVPSDGCFPLAPSFDHVGPMATTVEGCIDAMRTLAPELGEARLESLEELRVGVAWLDDADAPVRAVVADAAARLPDARPLDFPVADGAGYAVFMREVADVHAGLFPEHADSYGDNVRTKLERCHAVGDGEVEAGRRELAEYRERAAEALDAVDLLLTPTTAFAAPPADVEELAIRERGIRFTYPFDALGWPALALPCGRTADGLHVSVQLVGAPGDDARVLAAGALLASLV